MEFFMYTSIFLPVRPRIYVFNTLGNFKISSLNLHFPCSLLLTLSRARIADLSIKRDVLIRSEESMYYLNAEESKFR